MNLNSIKSLFVKDIKRAADPTPRRSFDYKMLSAYAQAYDIEFDSFSASAIERISTVYQAIDILSNTIARIPTTIITDKEGDGDFEQYKEHFWYKQIRFKPNKIQSDYEFKRLVATSVYMKGNAYVYNNIYTGEREFIHPDLIDDIKIENGSKVYYSKQLNYKFIGSEISHYYKLLDLTSNSLKGISPLDALKTSNNILHLAQKTTEEYYKHAGRSPLVIERDVDKSINQASLEESVDNLKSTNLNGRFSIREPLVLPPSLRVKELKLTSEDLMFVSVLQYTNEQIANLFGIPSYLIYASKGVAGKFEQENLAFKNTTIANYLEMYKAITVDSLIVLDDRVDLNADIVYDINKLMDLDFNTISTNAVQLSNNGVITKNEARQMIGKKRVDSENADKLLTQAQWVSIEDRDLSNTSTKSTE